MSFNYSALSKDYKLYNTPKIQSKIFVLDLETNGYGTFEPPTQIPTQISWIMMTHDGNKLAERDYIVKGATSVKPGLQNSLSVDRIEREGVPIGDVIEEFYSQLSPHDFIVTHNAAFDVGLLVRYRSPPFPLQNVICTMRDTTDFCQIVTRYGSNKWPKLKELAEKLNVPFDDTSLHDSLYDCEILQQCFFNLIKKHKSVFNIEMVFDNYVDSNKQNVKESQTKDHGPNNSIDNLDKNLNKLIRILLGQTDFSPRVDDCVQKDHKRLDMSCCNQPDKYNIDSYQNNKNVCELFNNLHEHQFVVYSWKGLITAYIVRSDDYNKYDYWHIDNWIDGSSSCLELPYLYCSGEDFYGCGTVEILQTLLEKSLTI